MPKNLENNKDIYFDCIDYYNQFLELFNIHNTHLDLFFKDQDDFDNCSFPHMKGRLAFCLYEDIFNYYVSGIKLYSFLKNKPLLVKKNVLERIVSEVMKSANILNHFDSIYPS